ncbi:MAG: hypothetical protein H0X67_09765 [Acidobacteria bacterium]|nr:hypothetical protein [Acidobacteriota bacterium]
MRSAVLGWLVVTMILVALGAGWAADRREETVLTVDVSSAEHEAEEGYFALGEHATVMAKPGSDLHRFLTRHRGRTVRIVLSREDTRELSRLRRE